MMTSTTRPRRPGSRWSPVSGWIALSLVLLACLPDAVAREGSRKDLLQSGKAALEDSLYDLAEKKFEDYLRKARDLDMRAEGTLLLVQALFGQKRYDEVIARVLELEPTVAGNPAEGGLLYWRAMAQVELGQYTEALAALKGFENRFAGNAYAAPAIRLRIRAHQALGKQADAVVDFEEFHERFGGTDADAEVMLDWAQTLLQQSETNQAEKVLTELRSIFPGSIQSITAEFWQGQLYRARNQVADANRVLREVAANTNAPTHLQSKALAALADVYLSQTNLPAAEQALTQAISLAPGETDKAELRLRRGQLLVRMQRVDEGLALFQETIVKLPSREKAARAQLELAEILLEQDDFARAAREFQRFLEAFSDQPGLGRALLGKGWSLWGQGLHAEAATTFEKAHAVVASPEAKEEALVKAADSYFEDRQFEKARRVYQRVGSEFPSSVLIPQVRFQAAECMARQGKFPDAMREFSDLVRDFPELPISEQADLRLAGLEEEQSQWEQALQSYERILKTYAKGQYRVNALHARGMLLYRLGRFESALTDFEQVVKDFPANPLAEQAFYMRGWSLYLLGKSEEALTICREFIEKYPNSRWAADVLFWLGEYAYNQGDYMGAERRFASLAARQPVTDLSDDALYWAGRAAATQKEYLRAIEHFSRLAKSFPESALVVEARFAQGDALSELGQFASAILAFEEVIKKFPGNYLVNQAWGRIGDCQYTLALEDSARYAKAIAAYRTIMDDTAAPVELRMQAEYKLGRCYEKMGMPAEAVEHYMNVVYFYYAEWEKGLPVGVVWFTRAAFSAAALKETAQDWEAAAAIYRRVIDSGVPASPDAQNRLQRLESEHGLAPATPDQAFNR